MKFWLLRVNRNLRLTPHISFLNAARGSSSLGAGTRRVGLCGEGDLAEKKGPPDLLIEQPNLETFYPRPTLTRQGGSMQPLPGLCENRTANLQSIGK